MPLPLQTLLALQKQGSGGPSGARREVFVLSLLNSIAGELANPFGPDTNDVDGAAMQVDLACTAGVDLWGVQRPQHGGLKRRARSPKLGGGGAPLLGRTLCDATEPDVLVLSRCSLRSSCNFELGGRISGQATPPPSDFGPPVFRRPSDA